MTTLSDRAVLEDACAAVGLNPSGAVPLRQHATDVYLLPDARVVVRVGTGPHAASHAERSVMMTRWLSSQGFPTIEPIPVMQPVHRGQCAITFWTYYPQPDEAPPSARELGSLLRQLHNLPAPPIDLPTYRPLERLADILHDSTWLDDGDRQWLQARQEEVLAGYQELDFPLGIGLIHGDAYPGNLLWDGKHAILGDWDETSTGPRELDLANTHHGRRFGRSAQEIQQFDDAYGYDLATWPGLPTLMAIRDLHTLSSFIRRADLGNDRAGTQLAYRIRTLRDGDVDALWNAA